MSIALGIASGTVLTTWFIEGVSRRHSHYSHAQLASLRFLSHYSFQLQTIEASYTRIEL